MRGVLSIFILLALCASAFALPDLYAGRISWTPASPYAGDTVTFYANFSNLGNTSSGLFWVYADADTAPRTTCIGTYSLNPGGWASMPCNFIAHANASKTNGVTVFLDINFTVNETNENNNFANAAIPVRFCGDGACDASRENCTTCSSDCGICPPRCGDGTCNGNETCATCPGDCGTCAPVCGDAICNGNETCSTCSLDCGACATYDIYPESYLAVSRPGTDFSFIPAAGEQAQISLVMYNTGPDTTPPSHATIKIDGQALCTNAVPAMAPFNPGQGTGLYPISCLWVATAGSHTLQGQADSLNEVRETNENNNIVYTGLNVTCGNGICEPALGENSTTCPSDCPACTPRTYCSGTKRAASVDAQCKVTYTDCGNGPYCCQGGKCIKDVSGKTCRIPQPVAQVEGPDMTPWYVAGIGAILLLGFAAYFYLSKKKK